MNWKSILLAGDMAKALRREYTAYVGIADGNCDVTSFARALIHVYDGRVVKVVSILDNPVCQLPDMNGWYVPRIVEWINEGSIPGPINMISWIEKEKEVEPFNWASAGMLIEEV